MIDFRKIYELQMEMVRIAAQSQAIAIRAFGVMQRAHGSAADTHRLMQAAHRNVSDAFGVVRESQSMMAPRAPWPRTPKRRAKRR
jgi:hypothetical protein